MVVYSFKGERRMTDLEKGIVIGAAQANAAIERASVQPLAPQLSILPEEVYDLQETWTERIIKNPTPTVTHLINWINGIRNL
jgi:hypothetical protein